MPTKDERRPSLASRLPVALLAAIGAAGLAASVPSPLTAPLAAQPAACGPVTIYLPVAMRDEGVALQEGTPAPRPSLDACPDATPSATPVGASSTRTSTPMRGTSTPTVRPIGTTATGTASATVRVIGTPASATATVRLTGTPATATATVRVTGTPPSPTPPPSPTATWTPGPTATPGPSPTAAVLDGIFGAQAYQGDFEPLWDGTLSAAGVRWVRVEAFWRVIEPADTMPPTYDWRALDTMVEGIRVGGMKPLVVVYTKPAWAASQSCGPIDKAPLDRYADFIGALVERYDGDGRADAPGRPNAHDWEIENEPDFTPGETAESDYGSCYGDDPAAYGEQLRSAYGAVKAADPSARVVFGAVAYDRFRGNPDFDPPGPFSFSFVSDVITALKQAHGSEPGWPFFDVLGFHNYSDFRNNWDGNGGREPEIVGKAARLRADQLTAPGVYDLSHIPLLASEIGIPSGPSDVYTERNETYQAAYVGQVMIRSAAARLDAAIWFTTSDRGTGDCGDPYAWLAHGLLRTRFVADRLRLCEPSPLPGYNAVQRFEPKPAVVAFRTMGQLLRGATYGRQLTVDETDRDGIEAHLFTLADGRAAIAAFTDNGERLGRKGWPDLARNLRIDRNVLPGFAGTVQVIDAFGNTRTQTGESINVPLTFQPVYIVVAR